MTRTELEKQHRILRHGEDDLCWDKETETCSVRELLKIISKLENDLANAKAINSLSKE